MNEPQPKLENDIKAMVLDRLLKSGEIAPDAVLMSEFSLDNFARRVDLAYIKGERFIGIEIKSQADSLARLENQLNKYLFFFDKVILVAASKHIGSALKMSPPNISIWEQCDNKLTIKRRGKLSAKKTPSENLIRLLTLKELRLFDPVTTQNISRNALEQRLSKKPKHYIRKYVIECLTRRYQTSSKLFWSKMEGKEITPSSLKYLSKNYHPKKIHEERKIFRENFWGQRKNQLAEKK